MARSKVILPANSTGQNMGITTYSNGVDTVGASETILVDPATGNQIPATAANGLLVDVSRMPAGASTETTLAAVLAKLTADPATQTTLAAILAKLIAAPATSAKQPALGTAGAASADVLSVQGVASMTALKTDSSATTQPVSAASLPLPTGASTETTLASVLAKIIAAPATSAKQPALGTAGTPSSDVLTVQGAASGTALKVDASATTQPVHQTDRVTTAAGDTVTSSSNSNGVLTLAATAGQKHVLSQISWSYSATPFGGRVTISDNGTVVRDWDIIAGGPGFIEFNTQLKSAAANTAMVVTIYAAGLSVVGKINATNWLEV